MEQKYRIRADVRPDGNARFLVVDPVTGMEFPQVPYMDYPKMLYGEKDTTTLVRDIDEYVAALDAGWYERKDEVPQAPVVEEGIVDIEAIRAQVRRELQAEMAALAEDNETAKRGPGRPPKEG